MALISCAECGKEISDKAPQCPHCGAPCAVVQPPVQAVEKKGGMLKWVIGIPIGIFLLILIIGSIVGNSPEAQERNRERDKISACWDLQKKKSLDPSTARFAARLCERMEEEFRRKHGRNP